MDVMEAIRTRRSVRSYRSDPIPDPLRENLEEALQLAPSACNYQPWHFIMVSDNELREQVASACREQMFMAEAPLIVVGCAVPEQAYQTMGGYWNSAVVDVSIAMDHLMLAAAEAGLGTCWIGAFDEKEVRDILKIPDDVTVVALTPVGYPKKPDLLGPSGMPERKDAQRTISWDQY